MNMGESMIVYISKASRSLSPQDVEQIARSAATKNRKQNITGLLLQVGKYYIQVLEGYPWQLEPLMNVIKRDTRHQDMRVIYNEYADAKLFPQWNMGYFNSEMYHHSQRVDVASLFQYTHEAFANNKESEKALLKVVMSMPELLYYPIEDAL